MKHRSQEFRKKQTRNHLIEAALTCFTEKGYYGTTSKDIAKVAGLSIGSFYKYFDDKKSILLEILNSYIEETHFEEFTTQDAKSNQMLDIQSLIKHLVSSHNFSENFYHQVTLLSKTDAEIKEVYSIYQEKINHLIIQQLKALNIDKRHEEMKILSTLIYSLIESSIHMIKFQGLEEDKVIQELSKLLNVYLS